MRIGGQIDIVGGIASDFCTWVTMASITVYFLYATVSMWRGYKEYKERAEKDNEE